MFRDDFTDCFETPLHFSLQWAIAIALAPYRHCNTSLNLPADINPGTPALEPALNGTPAPVAGYLTRPLSRHV